jgi:hypothetical protein
MGRSWDAALFACLAAGIQAVRPHKSLSRRREGTSMESVYLETTFISYLVARPSRDLIVAGHQQITQEWWANRHSEFECGVSQVVVDEASVGDPAEVQKRLAIIGGLPALDVTADATALAKGIMAAGILPPHVVRDAAHVAVAAVYAGRADGRLTPCGQIRLSRKSIALAKCWPRNSTSTLRRSSRTSASVRPRRAKGLAEQRGRSSNP